MIYCRKCGKIMNLENGVATCSCGFSRKLEEGEGSTSEKMHKKAKKGRGYVKDKNELATYPHVCKKCGYDKAQVIEMGVWYSDEAGVIRYKCGKCGFAEQDKESNT